MSARRAGTGAIVISTAIGLVLIAWGLFFAIVLPGRYAAASGTFGVGLALTAFLLGTRHAFDADHVAAIDNTSRRLVADGRDASTVGMWFAVGHSTVVLLAVGLVTAGAGAFTAQLRDPGYWIAAAADIWGPTVSSLFLFVMAAANTVILIRTLRGARHAGGAGAPFPGGPVVRLLARTGARLDRPWKMYVVGLLFGLGFDTASTITLLLLAGGAGLVMPWYAAMVMPLLFTAGMVACDGVNGLVMARLYRWSAGHPGRRTPYNVVMLALSVAVALVVGGVGLAGVLVDALHVSWLPIDALAAVDLDHFGFVIAAVLVIAGAGGLVLARVARRSTAT